MSSSLSQRHKKSLKNHLLACLDSSKAPGPDNIPTLSKECARELAPSVFRLYNLPLVSGNYGTYWMEICLGCSSSQEEEERRSHKLPSYITSLRDFPERYVYVKLKDYLCTFFDSPEHDFLEGRSTVTQLLTFYHEIGQALDKGLQSDIVIPWPDKGLWWRFSPETQTLPLRYWRSTPTLA